MESGLIQILGDHYQLGNISSLAPVKTGVSNLNFKADTSSGNYMVRICRFEPENQLRVMVPFLQFAEQAHFPAPRLILTKEEKPNTYLDNDPVIVTTLVPGTHIKPTDLTEERLSSLSKTLQALHRLDWYPENNSETLHPSFILKIWDEYKDQPRTFTYDRAQELYDYLQQDYARFSSEQFLAMFQKLPAHVVHGDLIPGNILFDHDQVSALVDLEEIGKATRLLDIARFITVWLFDGKVVNEEQKLLFLNTYNTDRPLTSEEEKALPIIIHYVTFRHAVFIYRMAIQGRVTDLEQNPELQAYFCLRKHS